MREQLEEIIKHLRMVSEAIGRVKIPTGKDGEDSLDSATECVKDAIDELQDILSQ